MNTQKQHAEHNKQSTPDTDDTTVSYSITYETLEDRYITPALHEKLRYFLQELHKNPQKLIPELREAIAQHPDEPRLFNYLSNACAMTGEMELAKKVNELCLKHHPDYLFAKTQQAQFYLRQGEHQKIPALFNNKFDLKLLYPQREVFHIGEATAFNSIIGIYFIRMNDDKQVAYYATLLLETLAENDSATQLFRQEYQRYKRK